MMRAEPTATVSNPPPTAASRKATPSGRLQCHPRNWNGVEAVFWAMKTSSRIRVRKPPISADHKAAARVNLTACSPDAGPTGGVGAGGVGEPGGLLLMYSSLPYLGQKETDNS